MKNILVGTIFSVVFAIAGVSMILGDVSNYRIGKASSSWPHTQGVVATSDAGDGETYPSVEYRYTVNGVHYAGSKIAFGEVIKGSDAQVIADGYPEGSIVSVYHDPARHDRSVLQPGVPGNLWLSFLLDAVVVLAGIGIGMALIKSGLQCRTEQSTARPTCAQR